MTTASFIIFLIAVSLIVTYVTVIYRSLNGAAANDPNYDVDASTVVTARSSSAASDRGHASVLSHAPRHA